MNILFVEKSTDFANDIGNVSGRLAELGMSDVEIICIDGVTCHGVKSLLESRNRVGGFAIVTDKREKFAGNFPNNTIEVKQGENPDNVCKYIAYIMSNFGREYRQTSKIFVTSDTHFFHENIIKYCNRPWSSAEEMNEGMIANWNNVVGSDDIVIHLGDFCFGGRQKVESVFNRLNGEIDLVLGNHDKLKISDYYAIGFHRVYDRPVVYDNFFVMSHAPLQWIKEGDVYYNVFGHVHDMPLYRTWTKNSCCACVERHNYTPILFETIKSTARRMNGDNDNVQTL